MVLGKLAGDTAAMSKKISIITVCYNSAATIEDTIKSVLAQDYLNIEYIVIDGGSTDGTVELVERYKAHINHFVSEADRGIYDAMNKGVNAATGDFVGILNSDDFYPSPEVLSAIASEVEDDNCDIVFGDLVFVSATNVKRVVRSYLAAGFRPWKLRFGWMPPHPATFIRRRLFAQFGNYALTFKTGADYEMFVRLLLRQRIDYRHVAKVIVHMRMGGATSSGWRSHWRTSLEMVQAIRQNGYYSNLLIVLLRLPIKFFQLRFKFNV